MSGKYDLVIVGGDFSGASLLYTAATFTDIESIALLERDPELAAINSHHTSDSQTLHFGDIETNDTLEKAESVKTGAEMLAGSLENHDPDSMLSYANILVDRILLPHVVRKLCYDVPEIGRRQFLRHVQKVVPDVELDDIQRAKGYGGIWPQIVETRTGSLDMGEAKIVGDDSSFNITPPGASTRLKNAERDAETILDCFEADYLFEEAAFRADTTERFPRGF
ncbi:MAG: hypothetical protein ABEI27_10965 [Halobellus sp.]|uniref:hypothetical protein n=1 Tax=Halobellus sp. TaxID=1979212 RepID=UPI0035D4B769